LFSQIKNRKSLNQKSLQHLSIDSMRANHFYILLCLIFTSTSCITSQEYIGAGNDNGITATASHQYADANWVSAANAQNTINGNGLEGELMEASRFLAQATMGYDQANMESVVSMGIEGWIDDQLQLPTTYITPEMNYAFEVSLDTMTNQGYLPEDLPFRPGWDYFNYGWWHVTMTNQDQLRHRMAYALSQIFVISFNNTDLSGYGDGLATYYDMLLDHSFGNYRDLLKDVTYSPMMGFYLSHLNNPKSDPANNIRPDENYAREIMQLFSIGLYELNLDGTRKTDANGDFIPTYGQDEIREFAKIFTGLSVGGSLPAGIPEDYNDGSIYFDKELWTADVTVPMVMYDDSPGSPPSWQSWHEPGSKTLLNGYVVPAGQTGDEDIDDAIDNLFNHPNVGPFVAYRLIQRLVKSNPTPAYVQRIAATFNDNGLGVRGDMAAVTKAILMDAEARQCSYLQSSDNSRLREPFMRYTQYTRAVDKIRTGDRYWNIGYHILEDARQTVLGAPSVFNFYLPDHAPGGDIAAAGLVAPEYNLHDSRSSVGFINNVRRWNVWWGNLFHTWDRLGDNYTVHDIARYKELSKDSEALINELDRVFTHGRLSDNTRAVLRNTMEQMQPYSWDPDSDEYLEYRVYLTTYLLMISADYAVMR